MITVHHLNNSRSQRVLWLLEELGADYEVTRYERDRDTMLAPDDLRAVHPLGKSPVITEDDVTVAETGAIIEYLLDRFDQGRLRPTAGTEAARSYTYWLHYAEGSAMPLLLLRLVFGRIASTKSPPIISAIVRKVGARGLDLLVRPQLPRHLDLWEQALVDNAWFAGPDFTAADIMMSFPVEAAAARVGLGDRSKTRAWLDAIHARPAYQAALEAGGPYEIIGGGANG